MTFQPHSSFLSEMLTRGFLDDCTDLTGLDHHFGGKPRAAYIGFDATAKSLHVGSLIQIMMLRWLQKTGHKPIVLMGGGTTKIGDPSFRARERPLMEPDEIEANIAGIRKIFERYLQFGDGPTDAIMLNNAEWLDDLNYLSFLRDIGRHFSVNRMLAFDSVKSRLEREQSLSFLEFNYMLLQSYDFLVLHQKYDCSLQMGGSDQWGNIVNGVDLVRRVESGDVFGLTSPLLTTAAGQKMGKTAQGAVWLNSDLLSPYEFWQFWRNTADADISRFLALFTELDADECKRLGAAQDNDINRSKSLLADKVTELAHGVEATQDARRTAESLFAVGDRYSSSENTSALPQLKVTQDEIAQGLSIIQALTRSGLAPSGKEARRLIASNAVRLNNTPVTDNAMNLTARDLQDQVILSVGRKRHVMICSIASG